MYKGYEYFVSHSPQSSYEILAAMDKGIPTSTIDKLAQKIGISKQKLCDAIGLNTRTISRRDTLKLDEADKLYRLSRIYALAVSVLEDETDAVHWLTHEKIALNKQIPLSLLNTDLGAREVETLLNQIEHGVYN